MKHLLLSLVGITLLGSARGPCEERYIKSWLDRGIIGKDQGLEDVKAFVQARVPRMPKVADRQHWQTRAETLRRDVFDKVLFRGRAASWRNAETRVQWLQTIDGGPGYRIRKLRYEALPGMWIPALLYEPLELSGKVPVVMNVNGHDRAHGKAAKYKQIRCMNQATSCTPCWSPPWGNGLWESKPARSEQSRGG